MQSPGESGHDEEQASCLKDSSRSHVASRILLQIPRHTLTPYSRTHDRSYLTLASSAILLRLPALYFSRVARVFEDAEVSRGDMQRIIDSARWQSGCGGVQGGTAAASSNANDIGSLSHC